MNLISHPHRRLNPLTGEWVLVSPNRLQRPWQGKTDAVRTESLPDYDKECYLCPGNIRANGEYNPGYKQTYVFTNDYSALYLDIPEPVRYDDGVFAYQSEQGVCRVICYTPNHNISFATMDIKTIEAVIEVWMDEYRTLGNRQEINYVQIFENRGKQAGCSNPHPHGQIWANAHIPVLPQKETDKQLEYLKATDRCLLCDYAAREKEQRERIVAENNHFLLLVPFWAVWPYEVMILPKRHIPALSALSPDERSSLAEILSLTCIKYDNLFQTDFPYSMGIHQQPTDGNEHREWHCHFHFNPPLLRSAAIAKFMVGYEMMAMPQRDITPETSAGILQELETIHYTQWKEKNS